MTGECIKEVYTTCVRLFGKKGVYCKEQIEVVNAYRYLGLYFSTKLNTGVMVSELVTKAKLKINLMFKSLWKLGHIPYEVFVKVFDAQIAPSVLYGAEIWGLNDIAEIERAHVFALKGFLNVSRQTSNSMVYGETGRFPLFVNANVKAVKYWLRVFSMSKDRYTWKSYNMLVNLDTLGKETWATSVRIFLCAHGFGHVWLHQGVGDSKRFITELKGKLVSNFMQNWHVSINSSDRYDVYKNFKSVIMTETYISVLCQKYLRDVYCRFRLGISDVLSNKNRYTENDSLCQMCKEEVETEIHFLLTCPAYCNSRALYILQAIMTVVRKIIFHKSCPAKTHL